MNKYNKQKYIAPSIHMVSFKVELGTIVSPTDNEETVTWIEDNDPQSEGFGREQFRTNTQDWNL